MRNKMNNQNFIYAKDISEFVSENFSDCNEAIILGKGPTFCPISEPKNNILTIAANDAINESDHVDILVTNDIETYDIINGEKLSKVKYLILARGLHKNGKPNKNVDYTAALDKIKDSFSGNVIVYNLQSSAIDERYITLRTTLSSGNSAADFIGQYLPNIKKVTCYGIGTGSGYADVFNELSSFPAYFSDAVRLKLIESLIDIEVVIK